MRILVDADSCPKPIRTIILKAANRTALPVYFAADRILPDCKGKNIHMVVVATGADSADLWLIENSEVGDLCITRDIILADKLVQKEFITVIDDRGNKFTKENMRERLSLRNAMADFREAGIFGEKNKPLNPKEIQLFANMLDRELTVYLNKRNEHEEKQH